MAKIFADMQVKYFSEDSKESGDSVVSDMWVEAESTEIENASLAAGWQPHVDPEPILMQTQLQIHFR